MKATLIQINQLPKTASTQAQVTDLTLSPSSFTLATNERYPFLASLGTAGYTYSVSAGGGSVSGTGVFTAPSTADTSLLRVTDSVGGIATSSLTTKAFNALTAYQSTANFPTTFIRAVYDGSGNFYVIGTSQIMTFTNINRWIVLKWDGTAWTELDVYALVAGKTSNPRGITLDGSGNIYVVGAATDASDVSHWIVRKYNGTSWSTVDDYSYSTGKAAAAYSVGVDSNGLVYVIGDAVNSTSKYRWIVRKSANGGASWTVDDDYVYTTDRAVYPRAAAIDSNNQVYVGGMVYTGTEHRWVVRKYDGTSWSVADDFKYVGSTYFNWPNGIAIDSSDNVYVSGSIYLSSGGTTRWLTRKWNGTSWSSVDDFLYTAHTSTTPTAIAIDPSNNVYVTGSTTNGTANRWLTRKFNGTTWSTFDDFAYTPSTVIPEPSSIVAVSSSAVYSFGKTSAHAATVDHGMIRAYNGTSWSTAVEKTHSGAGVRMQIRDSAVDSSGNIYVVGSLDDGFLASHWMTLRWNGTAWSLLDVYYVLAATYGGSEATSVVVDSNDHVYVAGYARTSSSNYQWTVRKYDGSSWSNFDTYYYPGRSYAQALTMTIDSSDNLYVGGYAEDGSIAVRALLRKWDGSSWSNIHDTVAVSYDLPTAIQVTSTGKIYMSVTKCDAQCVWLIRYWNGTAWSDLNTYTLDAAAVSEVADLGLDASGNLYVLGYGTTSGVKHAILRKWDGSAWSIIDDFTNSGAGAQYYSLLIDGDNVYMLGSKTVASVDQWLVRKWNGYYVDTVDTYSNTGWTQAASSGLKLPSSGDLYFFGTETKTGSPATALSRKL